jgi:hypothetical protein
MKMFKKLLAALLSTTMVASMAFIPSMADDADDAEIKTVTFDKYYISEKGEVLPDETFTFTMVPATVPQVNNATPKTADGLEIVSGIALTQSTVTLNFDSSNTDIEKTTMDGNYAEKLTG